MSWRAIHLAQSVICVRPFQSPQSSSSHSDLELLIRIRHPCPLQLFFDLLSSPLPDIPLAELLCQASVRPIRTQTSVGHRYVYDADHDAVAVEDVTLKRSFYDIQCSTSSVDKSFLTILSRILLLHERGKR